MSTRVQRTPPDRPGAAAGPQRPRPSRAEAEAAVRTLLAWAGDDPEREGLRETPGRVVSAYEEFFAGYRDDPTAVLGTIFEETEGYDELVEQMGPLMLWLGSAD